MPRAGLTDIQKSDLQIIWNNHSDEILCDSTETSKNAMPLRDHTMGLVARLVSFYLNKLEEFQDKPESMQNASLVETFKTFIPLLGSRLASSDDSSSLLVPRIFSGRHVVNIDHTQFLAEIDEFEGGQYINPNTGGKDAFGGFLYHVPQYGLCVVNCAVALTLMTLLRRRNTQNTLDIHGQRGAQSSYILPPGSFLIQARFYNAFPFIPIADVKTDNAYKFITLRGRIIKVHTKRLRLLKADVFCLKCGIQFEHKFMGGRYELPPRCNQIGGDNNNGKKCPGQKFELLRKTAKYIDCQMLRLQEEDNVTSAAGRTPRHIDLEVTHDLVDACHAGDCVRVVGVIHAQNSAITAGRKGKQATENSTYHLFMKANSVVNTTAELHDKKKGATGDGEEDGSRGLTFTEDQLNKITKVAHADHLFGPLPLRMAFPFDLLVRSICPGIIGHDMVKAGILLALLGGTPSSSSGLEDVRSGVSIRSSIHILIVGDPGMGKSCMLLATTKVAARSVYVGGNTSSTTGLTVSLSKEKGGEMGIEAGALVLADQGVCCIDEFDKMAKTNQDGLLEAMEQQQISIAKAGVVASLPARCCVIAAANPKQGKYNMDKTVAENLNIAPPLLSRFDLVFILRDDADTDQDNLVSSNIMNMYKQKTNENDQNKRQRLSRDISLENMSMKQRLSWVASTQKALPNDLVKDYITYAREYCNPKITPDAAAVLKDYFMKLRYPDDATRRSDSVPITTRQLEALIRLAQARAKACLREFVLKEDAEDVVELMRDSVNQVHMDGSGRLDYTRGGVVGKSKRKQKKEFVDALRSASTNSGQFAFSKDDFYRVSSQLNMPLNDFWTLVDELRFSEQPELRKGGDGMYYLL